MTLPISPVLMCPHDERKMLAQSGTNSTHSSNDYEERYVKLDPDYCRYHTWTNEPNNLDLYGVFSEEESNLASNFNVKGLKPVIKGSDSDMFLLTDLNHDFYLWDPWDGYLLRASAKWTVKEGLHEIEDKVDNIIRNLYWVLKQATIVFKDRIEQSVTYGV